MPRLLRIGIVGAGIRGQLFARALADLEGVEVSGIADVNERSRNAVNEMYGMSTFADCKQLIPNCDAVVIATPDFAHVEAACEAARAGLPMLLEKPVATSNADATEIRKEVAKAGVDAFVGFENRWAPAFTKAKSAIDNGEIGHVETVFGRLSDSIAVPQQMLSWAGRSTPGWFLMPHTVDLAVWLSGQRVKKVYAQATTGNLQSSGVETLDALIATLTLADGTLVSLESNWILPRSFPSIVDFRVDVIGTVGTITIDNLEQMLTVITDRIDYPRTLGTRTAGREQGPAAWMVQSFALRLMGHDEVLPSLDEGIHVTNVIDAIHTSSKTGMPVDVTISGE